jgi:imidazolonepropionase
MPEKPLVGEDFGRVPCIDHAYLVIRDGKVFDFGPMENLNQEVFTSFSILDCSGRFVLPAFCDSHTHLVFAKSRENEFVQKIQGLSYQEIAALGGGIVNSAMHVATMTEEVLFQQSMERLLKIVASGTGAIEIKSGYGLTLENELKILRVIQRLKNENIIPVKATFLAAHALPPEFIGRKKTYVDSIVNTWIPKVAKEQLADYVDLFCETGYFDLEDLDRIAEATQKTSMGLKVHVNQFSTFGGVSRAIHHKAHTVDHLETLTEEDLFSMVNQPTIATVLPGCSFFLNLPYAPARSMVDHQIPLSIASDFNPGSSPAYNLFLMWSLACINLRLSPEEALNALTVNASFAMGMESQQGAIFKGYSGKIIVTEKAPSLAYFPYAFGENHLHQMIN